MTKQTRGIADGKPKGEPNKRELERQMERTHESLAETAGEIMETAEQEYCSEFQTPASAPQDRH